MKPSRLVMQNFGAWRERTEIDFSQLDSVFLVCGKTGSGKTTIFDAITYALYGAAPGSRDGLESQLWSHYASPGDKPLVEFEFFLGETEYRAVRTPPYKRNKRGGGLTEVPPDACIFRREHDGASKGYGASGGDASSDDIRNGIQNGGRGVWVLVHDSIRETNQYIESRIGLTVDEFSKIILLPQGEFQRFLQMASTERVAVLEKLFPVDLHDRVSNLARDRSRELVQTIKRIDDEIARIAAEAGSEPRSRLAALQEETLLARLETERAVNAVAAADAALEKGTRDAEKLKRLADAKERLTSLESREAEYGDMAGRVALARRAAAVVPSVDQAERAGVRHAGARALLEERISKIAELESRSAVIAGSRVARETLEAEVSGIDLEMGELQGSVNAWNRALAAEEAWKREDATRAGLESLLEAASRRQETLAADLAAVSVSSASEADIRSRFELARAERELARRRLDEVSALMKLRKARNTACIDADLEESSFRLAEERAARARSALEDCESRLAADAAAALAAGLEEGSPCPVCGSTTHPAPARVLGSGVTETERQRLKKESVKAGEALTAAQGKLSAALASLHERETTLAESWFSYVSTYPNAGSGPSGTSGTSSLSGSSSSSDSSGTSGTSGSALSTADSRSTPPPPDGRGEESAAQVDLDSRSAAMAVAKSALDALLAARKRVEILAPALDAARLEADSAREGLSRLREKCFALKASLEESRKQAGGLDPSPRLAFLSATRETSRLHIQKLRAEIETWERDLADARTKLGESERQVELCAAEERDAIAGARLALEGQGFSGPAGMAEVRSATLREAEIVRLESAIASFGRSLSASRAEVATLSAGMPEDHTGPDGAPAMPDLAALKSLTLEARAAFDAASSRQREAAASRDRLAGLISDLESHRAEREVFGSRHATMFALSELLSGNISGRRLPFKNFVLGAYFRTVVRKAGARLLDMSDGRYTLIADEGGSRGQGRIGLEILVLDAYTGQSRPSGTLSGGERFLTSISLAFGLADTIRQRSGGVALDAIFIDEGFGSLDEEALDRAVSVLDRVRGSRMIGIVSHVAELRSRIPSQIVVEKGRSGSTLEIVG